MVDVEAQDFCAEAARILADVIAIAAGSAVPAGDEQAAVVGEGEGGAVMTIARPGDHDGACGRIWAARPDGVANNLGRTRWGGARPLTPR